jgi:hypothetical protein
MENSQSVRGRRLPLKRFADKANRAAIHLLIVPDGQISKFVSSPLCKNISVFPKPKSGLYDSLSRPTQRGVAQRHGTLGGMRWTLMALLTKALEADGEVVWS